MKTPQLYFRVWVTLTVVFLIAGVTAFGMFSDVATAVLDNLTQLVAWLVAAALCWWTGRGSTGVARRWRLLMALGAGAWAAGQAVWAWNQIVRHSAIPVPSVGDIGFLLFPLCAFTALVTMTARPKRINYQSGITEQSGSDQQSDNAADRSSHGQHDPRSPATSRSTVVLDTLIIIASMVALSWATALRAATTATHPTRLASVVATAYPVTDLVLITTAIVLAASGQVAWRCRTQLYLLGLGFLALACSDTVYAYLVNVGAAQIPPLVNVGYVAAPALISVAALNTAPTEAPTDSGRIPPRPVGEWRHTLLPYLTGGIAAVVVLIQVGQGWAPERPEVYFGLTLVALLICRQVVTSTENVRLLRRTLEAQRQATYQALHDPVTGLPNRTLFTDVLAQAVERHPLNGRTVSLFYIDLDDFKLVNDSLGHHAGDQALRLVGDRLASCVRDEGYTARLGGDEFAVLLDTAIGAPNTEAPIDEAQVVGDRILAALREPVPIDGRLIAISASVGVASSDSYASAPDPDTLLRHADAAMYLAKTAGKRTLVHHQAAADNGEPNPDLLNTLADSLAGDPTSAGFAVAYQPIVRIDDETTVAVEALARWTHPVTGTIGPDVFVPLAERAGLIAAVDNFVLDRACRDLEALTEYFGHPIGIHVNVSGARVSTPELPAAVATALRRHGVAPSRLIIEITETARIDNLDAARNGVTQLRRLGVRTALDDFGSGFNAFTQLHALPVDIVKLDHELSRFDTDPARARAMCRAIVAICADIGVTVIAEGVETQAQSIELARLGVTAAQGYEFGPPRSLPELLEAGRHSLRPTP